MSATHQATIAILPLDDRPPNIEFPSMVAEAAGLRPLLPPKEWLGTPWRSGQIERLSAWLEEAAAQADAVVLALDTLGYGGLVNSRRSADPVETVLARLELARRLKQRRPEQTLLAYNILMRITRGNDAEEEKPYWADYGERIFRLSYLEDRLAMLAGQPGDEDEAAALRAAVPTEIVQDYLDGRARNHAVNLRMVDWVAEGVFDYLIVAQDDTMEYGWNIAEGRRLRLHARRRGVDDRVSVYPGADETDMLLIARYAAQRVGFRPRVYPRYSSVRAGQIITAYEDRPMGEMVKAHLAPLGGVLAASPAEADLLLYVNTPAEVQGHGYDQYPLLLDAQEIESLPEPAQSALTAYLRSPHLTGTLREMHSVERSVGEFARSLGAEVAAGRSCAVVDVAYVNGADLELGDALRRHVELAQLCGYGGWNTAGNTLGTVLAHSVIRHIQRAFGAGADALAAHARFLFLRFVDDYLYQGLVRSQVALELLPALGERPRMTDLGAAAPTIQDEVGVRLEQAAAGLAAAHFAGRTLAAGDTALKVERLAVAGVFLPWNRLFEVGCRVELDASPAA